ncbi:MAG: nicotinate (nicotinamide) nucleotide adenylyltransferase [bacterium]|nr:nicotinate (nicotinamide) nucleotide adenylyltransferase [bacterium]
MEQIKKKILIYGGAFSPPHLGHASAIGLALRSFHCDEIWIMPSADRRDKKITADSANRKQMLEIMIRELFPQPPVPLIISSRELDRPRMTTTYETLMELEEKFPDTEFYFLIGADVLVDIESKWFNGKEIYRLANFVVMDCRGIAVPSDLPANFIYLRNREASTSGLSSTTIRNLLLEHKNLDACLTPGVAAYIRQQKLYQPR